jgi:hypothetical protein
VRGRKREEEEEEHHRTFSHHSLPLYMMIESQNTSLASPAMVGSWWLHRLTSGAIGLAIDIVGCVSLELQWYFKSRIRKPGDSNNGKMKVNENMICFEQQQI